MPNTQSQLASRPLVSIGVPAFNAERFLRRTLDSLLGQTLSDFELIISDNASTDGTPEICAEYVRRDHRVRYIRQECNIGAPRNWNTLVHEARGVYFKWASASDLCAPSMLEQCANVLQADPQIVLCYGLTQWIDENEQLQEIYSGDMSFDDASPSKRYLQVRTTLSRNNAQSGLLRLDVLRRTRLDRPYPHGDKPLMAELALYGKFYLIRDVLLFRCRSPNTFTSMLSSLEFERIFNPNATAPIKLISLRTHLDGISSITRSPISLSEKLYAYYFSLKLAWWDRAELLRQCQSILGQS